MKFNSREQILIKRIVRFQKGIDPSAKSMLRSSFFTSQRGIGLIVNIVKRELYVAFDLNIWKDRLIKDADGTDRIDTDRFNKVLLDLLEFFNLLNRLKDEKYLYIWSNEEIWCGCFYFVFYEGWNTYWCDIGSYLDEEKQVKLSSDIGCLNIPGFIIEKVSDIDDCLYDLVYKNIIICGLVYLTEDLSYLIKNNFETVEERALKRATCANRLSVISIILSICALVFDFSEDKDSKIDKEQDVLRCLNDIKDVNVDMLDVLKLSDDRQANIFNKMGDVSRKDSVLLQKINATIQHLIKDKKEEISHQSVKISNNVNSQINIE